MWVRLPPPAPHDRRPSDRYRDKARSIPSALGECAYDFLSVLADEPELRAVQELRDEALARYLEVMRTLGRVCADEGDVDDARRAWLRVLERDPYDEGTALRLIDALRAAGRLGEAAKQHRRYAERMRELGVPARP